MPNSTVRKHFFRRLLYFFSLILVCSTLAQPICAEASWVDREGSGIYDGGSLGFESDNGEEIEEEEQSEGSNWFLDLIDKAVAHVFAGIGNGIYGVLDILNASLDRIIFGRLLSNPPLFTFDLGKGNIWGIVGAVMYRILRDILIVGAFVVFIYRLATATWKSGVMAKSALLEAFSGLIGSIAMMALMPYFLDVALYIRDLILYFVGTTGATALFGAEGTTLSITEPLAEVAGKSIVNGLLYIGSVLLNGYFAITYVAVALSMCINFFMFPPIAIMASWDKSLVGSWVKEVLSDLLVPILDAILIMIPAFVGMYGSTLGIAEGFGVAVMELGICYCIIPARVSMRRKLGLSINPMESFGAMQAGLLGSMLFRKGKEALGEHRQAKKNAEADREAANMEEDLDALDREEAQASASATASGMRSADEIMGREKASAAASAEAVGAAAEGDKEDESQDKDEGFGMEQSYAESMRAKLDAEEEELDNHELDEKAAAAKNSRIAELEADKQRLEDEIDELNDDDTMDSTKKFDEIMERTRKLQDIDDELKELNTPHGEEELKNSISQGLSAARQRRDELNDEYERVAKDPMLTEEEREKKLNALSSELNGVNRQIGGMEAAAERQRIRQERADLSKEPQMLRQENQKLNDRNQQLTDELGNLNRQRQVLVNEQGKYAAGTSEFEKLGTEISSLDGQIRNREQELGSNILRQNSINNALGQQQAELLDRQKYNYVERARAQADFDDAKKTLAGGGLSGEEAKYVRDKMERSRQRLADIAQEDARIGQKMKEISPDLNMPTAEDLEASKRSIRTKQAGIQKQIAALEEKVLSDPDNAKNHRQEIARLRSEHADANMEIAKIDQAMQFAKAADIASGKVPTGHGPQSGIASEYSAKRQAILEKYANIDNFDSPQFADISREKKAQLYRERAVRDVRLSHMRLAGGALGAAGGAIAGTWLGMPGIMMGSGMGGTLGSLGGQMVNVAYTGVENRLATGAEEQVKPLSMKIAADLMDVTRPAQVEKVQSIQRKFADALDSGQFTIEFMREMKNTQPYQEDVKAIFRRNNVTAANYASLQPHLQKEIDLALSNRIENAERKTLVNLAGKEYVNLAGNVQRKIVREAVSTRADMVRTLRNSMPGMVLDRDWKKEYEEYIKDE